MEIILGGMTEPVQIPEAPKEVEVEEQESGEDDFTPIGGLV